MEEEVRAKVSISTKMAELHIKCKGAKQGEAGNREIGEEVIFCLLLNLVQKKGLSISDM